MYKIITILLLLHIVLIVQYPFQKRHIKYPSNFSKSLGSKDIEKTIELLMDDNGSAYTAPLHNLRSILVDGEIEKIMLALELEIDINAPVDSENNTMLTYVILYGYKNKFETARFLLDNGADMLKKNKWGYSALTLIYNDPDILKLMIDKGVNLNCPDGYKVFIDSVSHINNKIMRLMVDNGVAINCANKTGMTALMRTAYNKSEPELLKYLIKNGADVNARHPAGGLTPLMLAAWQNDERNLKILIENGADVNLRTAKGISALDLAVEFNNTVSIEILKKSGAVSGQEPENAGRRINIAEIITKNGSSETNRLHRAILEHDYDAVRKFATIYSGESLEYDGNMMTPLFYAIILNDVKAAKRLLRLSYIRHIDCFGMTAMRWARHLGRHKMIELIEKNETSKKFKYHIIMQCGIGDTDNFLRKDFLDKAIPMIKAGNYEKIKKEFNYYFFDFDDSKSVIIDALFSAAYCGDTEAAEFIINKGVDINLVRRGHENVSVLMAACFNNQYKMAEYLIDKGADINYENSHGYSIFHKITDHRQLELAELLIKKGYILNKIYRNGQTPLMTVCEGIKPDSERNSEYIQMAKLLLKYGADPNLTSGGPVEQETALMMTLENSNNDMARVLIENGADVNASDAAGITPLMIAARRGNVEGVAMLLKRGAAVNACDQDGENALFGAIMYGHNQIVKLLIENKIRVDLVNGRSETLPQIAKKFKNEEAAKLLEPGSPVK